MSHFYGTLQGSRGQATRCGTRASGVTTVAASWAGAVECEVYERDGEDRVRVEFIPWQGNGTRRELYDGPINPVEACTDCGGPCSETGYCEACKR